MLSRPSRCNGPMNRGLPWTGPLLYFTWRGWHNAGLLNIYITMQTETETSLLTQKTRELCQAILEEPVFRAGQERIAAFLADEKARAQYELVVSKGQALQEKQQQAQALSDAEVAEFEKQREILINNPVARGFMDAQEELHEIQHTIKKSVNKTLELGRVPTEADLQEDCGHGCSCH